MKSLVISLQARLALWCGQGLFNNDDYIPEQDSFLSQTKQVDYSTDYVLNLELRPDVIKEIYIRTSNLPEGMAASINKDAKLGLYPQLVALSQSADQEIRDSANYVLEFVNSLDIKQNNDRDAIIIGLAKKTFKSVPAQYDNL